jgi:3-keto-5-aminohexanoate cleavage enzyme
MRKVWIEAALNGPWSRALQPGIPDTIEAIIAEGIACAKAGAAIVHTHAYDGGGPQTFDWQVYARIIEGIRAKVDVPIYPSFPTSMIGGGDAGVPAPDVRFSHIDALASRGLIEFAAVDPGSVNFTRRRQAPMSIRNPTFDTRSISPSVTASIRRLRFTSPASSAPAPR